MMDGVKSLNAETYQFNCEREDLLELELFGKERSSYGATCADGVPEPRAVAMEAKEKKQDKGQRGKRSAPMQTSGSNPDLSTGILATRSICSMMAFVTWGTT